MQAKSDARPAAKAEEADMSTSSANEGAPAETPQSESDAVQESKPETYSDDQDDEHLTGLRLITVISAVALACFLMLLDMAVIGTVRWPYRLTKSPFADC